MLLVIMIAYFIFFLTVLIGGFAIKAVYKGYLSSKNRSLGLVQEMDLDNIIVSIAAFPFMLVMLVLVALSEFPFWFGKLLGKVLK